MTVQLSCRDCEHHTDLPHFNESKKDIACICTLSGDYTPNETANECEDYKEN